MAVSWSSRKSQGRHGVCFSLSPQAHEDVGEGGCGTAQRIQGHGSRQRNDGTLRLVELHPHITQSFEGYGHRIEIDRPLECLGRGGEFPAIGLLHRLVNEPR